MRCWRHACGLVSGIHARRAHAVIRNVLRDFADFEQRRANQIMHRHHDLANVNGVLRNEPVAPVVEAHAELRGPGCRLRQAAIRLEAEIGAAHQNGGPLGMVGRSDAAVRSIVGHINPVVDSQPRVGDARLRIHFRKSGVEHLAHVGFAVAIGVFEEQDVGGAGDDQPALPRHNAADFENVIREDRPLVGLTVAVGVLEQHDARTRRLALRRIVRIVQHLAHVDLAVFVEHHFDGIENQRLAGEQLDVKIAVDMHALQRVFGRQRWRVRMLAGAGNEKKNRGEDRKNRATGQPKTPGLEHSLRAIIARGDKGCLSVAQESPHFVVCAKERNVASSFSR